MRLKHGIFTSFLVIFAVLNVCGQNDFWSEKENLDVLLLKKDLAQVVREAETSASSDLPLLLRRVNLYYRIAHQSKVVSTVKQIVETVKTDEDRYRAAETIKYFINTDILKDAETLRIYLQKINFDGDVYAKFAQLCRAEPTACDASAFDEWLARRAAAALNESATIKYYEWLARRIDWREKVGFDNAEILNQFAADVREKPADLEAARRYLQFFRQPAEIFWLAETFASPHAYDYHELGETIAENENFSPRDENQKKQILQIAAQLLQKSLQTPYSEKDKEKINSRLLFAASIAPRIGNYEKQMRYWTKSKLAEVYRRMNEPQHAQPLVEELSALDKSDITTGNTSYLAGAVQAESGARVVESKILAEQSARQDSYAYWHERVSYYQGRKEPERIFDAYRQALAAIPFSISDAQSRRSRLFLIQRFADFARDEFGYYAEKSADLTVEEKRKAEQWKETESFLRAEFERAKSNLEYSSQLVQIINNKQFKNLLDEIFSRHAELLVAFFKMNRLNSSNNLLYPFLQSEAVANEKKASVMNQILKVVETRNAASAWAYAETVIEADRTGIYAARLIPILLKNLDAVEKNPNLIKNSAEDEDFDPKSVKNKYRENLFKAYLAANDWKSAEKLLLRGGYDSSINYSLWRLMENAAKNGASAEVVRLWKLKANLNRRDLENIEFLARNTEIKESLRAFYRQMKTDEPFSPIPDIALQKLEIK